MRAETWTSTWRPDSRFSQLESATESEASTKQSRRSDFGRQLDVTVDVSWTSRSGRPKRAGGRPSHIAEKAGSTPDDARQRDIAVILP